MLVVCSMKTFKVNKYLNSILKSTSMQTNIILCWDWLKAKTNFVEQQYLGVGDSSIWRKKKQRPSRLYKTYLDCQIITNYTCGLSGLQNVFPLQLFVVLFLIYCFQISTNHSTAWTRRQDFCAGRICNLMQFIFLIYCH